MQFLNLKSELIRNATSSVCFLDQHGVQHDVCAGQDNPWVEISPALENIAPGQFLLKVAVRNRTAEPLRLRRIRALDIAMPCGGVVDLGKMPWAWTVLELMNLDPGGVADVCIQRWEHFRDELTMAEFAAVACRATGRCLALGFTTFARQQGFIRLRMDGLFLFESLQAICELDGYRLDPGEELAAETLYLNLADDPRTAFDRYLDLILRQVQRPRPLRTAVGWGTWDYYLGGITEKDVVENVRWLARHRELPVEYIQIDHGFQRCEGDWLETNAKFPHGLKWLVAEIKKHGFKPGIWLCPFMVDHTSKVYREHPDWVYKDRNGTPIKVAGYATKEVYILDGSVSGALNWIRQLGRTITRDYGFQYVKLDGANYQAMAQAAIPANPKWTRQRAMREALVAFREGLGEDTYWLNASALGMSVGLVDAMRIGGDIGARWNALHLDKHHGERDRYPGPGFLYRGVISAINRFGMHRKLWINDPDYTVVRVAGDRSELSDAEARSWVTLVGMSNGLVMLSDRMAKLPRRRLELLQKILPPYSAGATPVGFFETENPPIMDLVVRNETEQWHVAAAINHNLPERPRDYKLDFAKLGLNPRRKYHVFDFWAGKYLGAFAGSYTTPKLQPHDCQVLGIREVRAEPQVLATDLHFTQGGLEIKSAVYDRQAKVFVIKTQPLGKKGNVYLCLPKPLAVKGRCAKVARRVIRVPMHADGREIRISMC